MSRICQKDFAVTNYDTHIYSRDVKYVFLVVSDKLIIAIIILTMVIMALVVLLFSARRLNIGSYAELRIYNDTSTPVLVQRLDGESTKQRRLEPGETMIARDGGDKHDPILGKFNNEHLIIAVIDASGTARGRLLFTPRIFGLHPVKVCASSAAEPPPVIDSATSPLIPCPP
jgi:hypothetical protein